MRRLSLLIILILIIGSLPPASGKAVSQPTQRDVFLYDYFSRVIVRFDYSLRYAIANESYSLVLANMTLSELQALRAESLYYQEKGINPRVASVMPPFYEFARDLATLVELTLQFQANGSPTLASGILTTVRRMEKTLSAIEAIKLRNGTKVLTFDTRSLRRRLEAIKELVSQMPPSGEFQISVSDMNPILYQTVTIFGSTPNNGTVTVVIRTKNLTVIVPLTPEEGFFSIKYRVNRVGSYTIYATQGKKRSNEVSILVRKIPTMIIADGEYSAFLNQNITLVGRLVDYYGQSLPGKEITIGNETVITDREGRFSKTFFSSSAATLNVRIEFPGDEIHERTSKTVVIAFKKYPLSITIEGPSEVDLGETLRIRGTIEPALDIPVTVYVNETDFSVPAENGRFSFEFEPKTAGRLMVYASFSGNEVYSPSKSNVIIVSVVRPESRAARYAGILLLAVLLSGLMIAYERVWSGAGKRETPRRPEAPLKVVPKERPVEEVKIPERVEDAYRLLRKKLEGAFGVSESMTPREVLKALKDWELYGDLKEITLFHERTVYGGIVPSETEIREFRRWIEKLLRGIPT